MHKKRKRTSFDAEERGSLLSMADTHPLEGGSVARVGRKSIASLCVEKSPRHSGA
jgi:hypothetical protein